MALQVSATTHKKRLEKFEIEHCNFQTRQQTVRDHSVHQIHVMSRHVTYNGWQGI